MSALHLSNWEFFSPEFPRSHLLSSPNLNKGEIEIILSTLLNGQPI